MEAKRIFYIGANQAKVIRCVEKQIGWDIVHYDDGTHDVFSVSVPRGYKKGRVIL